MRTVARGDALLEPSATRRLIEAYVHTEQASAPTSRALSAHLPPERRCRLIAGGLTNSEIAARLYISPLTCKSHVSSILTKLNARDRTQLVVMAYESGLVVAGQADRSSGLPRPE